MSFSKKLKLKLSESIPFNLGDEKYEQWIKDNVKGIRLLASDKDSEAKSLKKKFKLLDKTENYVDIILNDRLNYPLTQHLTRGNIYYNKDKSTIDITAFLWKLNFKVIIKVVILSIFSLLFLAFSLTNMIFNDNYTSLITVLVCNLIFTLIPFFIYRYTVKTMFREMKTIFT